MSEAKGTPPREYQEGTLDIVPGSADLPADGEKTTMTVESPSSNRSRRWIVLAVVLFILVLVATVIGLAVGLSRKKAVSNNDANSQLGGTPEASPSTPPAPTMSPAVFADQLTKVKDWITAQRYSTIESLNDPKSPQSMAVEFMASDASTIPSGDSSDETIKWVERYVLALFYFSTNGPNWVFQFNFLSRNLDTCGWFLPSANGIPIGASCVGRIGYVNTLLFNFDNNLVGELPSELGLLTSLKNILLPANNIQGKLPNSLASLTQMQWFDCTDCALDGNIPDWIGQWTSLVILGLTGNAITGSLPSTMSSLTALEEIVMEDNLLTGALTPVEGMEALRLLIVGNNGFVDTFGSNNNAPALQNLTVFDISDNKLVGAVPVHLFNYPSLQIVDLHGNRFTSFPDTIPISGAMEFLAVYDNPFEGTFPSKTIPNLSQLTHLDVSITGFTESMPTILGNMTKLEYLFLADTNFTAGPIPSEYQQLTFLTDFSLKHSGRTGEIPSWIGNLDRVVLLDLDDNSLTGPIPSVIGDMISLQFLLLNRNNLNGTIPTELALVQNLQVMFVDENDVTGDLTETCNVVFTTLPVFFAAADCNGTSPLVTCPCCARCCDHNSSAECNNDDFFLQQDPTLSSGYSRNGIYTILDLNITEPN